MRVIITILLLSPIILLAQSTPNTSRVSRGKDKDQVKKQVLESKLYTPTTGSSVISTYSDLRLKSDFGNESASATLGFSLKQSSISAYFEQPFKEKPKQVTFFNQEGLQSGTSFKIAFQHTFWSPKADFNSFDAARNDYAKRKKITDGQKIREITLGDLDDTAYSQVGPSINFGTPFLIGISYAGAKNEIDYITDFSAKSPSTEVKYNQNLQVSIGWILSKAHVVALSYAREIKFKGSDETSVYNFPAESGSLTYQKEVGLGAPSKIGDNKFQVEYRKLFVEKGVGPSLAINPRLFYLTSKKSINIELPFYFLRYSEDGKVKGLQGGFSLGYSSKLNSSSNFLKGFGASIFVAAPFDLFNLFKTK